jgi:hypothetical protein
LPEQTDQSLALSKLNGTTGEIDTHFVPPLVSGSILDKVDCLVASGTSLFVCGEFQLRNDGSQGGLAKIDAATGTVDSSFRTGLTVSSVFSLAVAGTKLIVGGQFQGNPGFYNADVKRLDAMAGAIDASFGLDRGPSDLVLSVTAGTDFVYAGGSMLTYGGNIASNIAMIDANTGLLDPNSVVGSGFLAYPGVNFVVYEPASVNAMVLRGGSLYVGGIFTEYNGQPAMDLAKPEDWQPARTL